jgi:DNA-binding response OmpR family regulator
MAEGLALIIEDSQTQAQIIGRMLEEEDWRYVIAKTLREAREALLLHHPNLIFVDIFLKDENTLPHLNSVRDLALEATICVMTAGNRKESIEETLAAARAAKVDYILRKPFNRLQVGAICQAASVDLLAGHHRKHALVIDDSQVVSNLTAQTLSDNGYRVSIAKSMEHALRDVDIAHVDLVVTDIFMPGMGGIEGTKIIKATWPHVKVLAMSAGLNSRINSERATYAAVKVGADAEIHKPFTPAELIDVTVRMMNLAA